MSDASSKKRPLEVVAGAEPIRLGSMLFTLVEPRRGHELEYNRWYERDHFYAGCMIGPYNFAGRRWVATSDLKARRDPDPSAITGEPTRGTYVAVYWVLDGYHDIWNRWAVRQVNALHAAGRMFQERDHVHTLLYRFEWEQRREPGGVPVELALDHPYAGLVAVWVDRSGDTPAEDFSATLREEVLPGMLPGTGAGLVAAFTPIPLLVDAPGDVPRTEPDDRRVLTLWFLDDHPNDAWDGTVAAFRQQLEGTGRASVVAAVPFIPTVPGTDRYVDQLWAD